MKIEIDLNDIFCDEGEPSRTLEENVRIEIIERLTGDMRKRIFIKIDEELSRVMNEQITLVMSEKMPEIIEDIMNVTYTPISNYGSKGEPTTFRNEIIKSVSANMVYAPKAYSSDENAFTKAVKSIVESKTKAIQEEITKNVDVKFKEDAIKFAVAKLSERLGLKA